MKLPYFLLCAQLNPGSPLIFFKKHLFIYLAVSGVSCGRWDLSLWHADSLVVAHRLRCSTTCGILVHGSGVKPASPALQGGFLTTGPPQKTLHSLTLF